MNFGPDSLPPLMPKTTIAPPLPRRYFRFRANMGSSSRPGNRTQSTFGCDFRKFATALAFSQWRSIRRGQGLDALKEHPRVVRRDAGAEVAQRHGPHPQNERQRTQGIGQVDAPAQAVVACVGRGVERMLARGPGELAAVDDNPADARAVPAEPLRQRVHDDVRAVVERLGEIGRRERRIDDQGNSVVMGDLGDGLEVGDLQRRVGDRLAEQGAGLLVDRPRRSSGDRWNRRTSS